jgi:hypothetical protein
MRGRDHLVVVLPGIGGSVLAPPGRLDQPVWAAGVRDAGNLLLRPELLGLGEHARLVPVGLVKTRKPVPCWTAVYGYDRLLDGLGGMDGAVVDDGSPAGRDLDADVVAVPYDFRLGMRDAAEQLEREVMPRLARRWPAEGDRERRVIVVAHSLGGLVARHWMGAGGGARWCRALVTLGTPARGRSESAGCAGQRHPAAGRAALGEAGAGAAGVARGARAAAAVPGGGRPDPGRRRRAPPGAAA